MKLITEVNEHIDANIIIEDSEVGKDKKYFIEGIFLQGNIKNRNGRVYPIDILENQVNQYVEKHVKEKSAFGELGHPDGPTINLDRASHMITALKREGDNFIGRAKIMSTPMGNIVKNLIDEGAKIGVSSRGLGSVKRNANNVNEVQDDFHLVTAADIVADPSAPDAFVQGIMEGKEWVYQDGVYRQIEATQIIDDAQKQINKIMKKTKNIYDRNQRNEEFVKVFYDFLSKLTK